MRSSAGSTNRNTGRHMAGPEPDSVGRFIFRDLCVYTADFGPFLAVSRAASVTFHLSRPGVMGQALSLIHI